MEYKINAEQYEAVHQITDQLVVESRYGDQQRTVDQVVSKQPDMQVFSEQSDEEKLTEQSDDEKSAGQSDEVEGSKKSDSVWLNEYSDQEQDDKKQMNEERPGTSAKNNSLKFDTGYIELKLRTLIRSINSSTTEQEYLNMIEDFESVGVSQSEFLTFLVMDKLSGKGPKSMNVQLFLKLVSGLYCDTGVIAGLLQIFGANKGSE